MRTLEDAIAIFDAGADKVSINSAALADPSLITRIAERFGSQAVIVAIDAKRITEKRDSKPYVSGGRNPTGRDAVTWAQEAEDRGAGEILLTSMDRDGTGDGFDCELTRAISEAVRHSRDRLRRRAEARNISSTCFAKAQPTRHWPLPSFTLACTALAI